MLEKDLAIQNDPRKIVPIDSQCKEFIKKKKRGTGKLITKNKIKK